MAQAKVLTEKDVRRVLLYIAAHKQRIALAEREARGYKSEIMDSFHQKVPDYTNETDAEYEHRRKQQFLRDVQRYEESKDDKGE